ncbi:MAG: nucleotidyltransferase domain-containing protein [Nitrospirae bacterium]|nr:nucleotidyltransferase domain-containing protein [Nitrospirota bacterium]
MNIRKINKELTSIWQEFQDVEIAYLFGSHVAGKARKTSDIDIAIYAPKLTLDRYCKLWARITKALGTEKIDLVTMSDKPASFRYQIIREGRVIYFKNEDLLNDFELKTWQTYMDKKHLRRIYLRNMHEGLRHGV